MRESELSPTWYLGINAGAWNFEDGKDQLPVIKDIPWTLSLMRTYLFSTLQRDHLPRETTHDTVKKLRKAPSDKEYDKILNIFLLSEGAYHSERCHAHLSKLDDPWGAEAKAVIDSTMWDFSRVYKQVAMGPVATAITEEIITANPEHIVDAPTASASFRNTVTDWIGDAVATVAKENKDTALWKRFQHSTEVSGALVLSYSSHATQSPAKTNIAPLTRAPAVWIEKSFTNTMPFVSDLLLEAAVSYARHHPDNLTPEALTESVHDWLPYFGDLESTYAHTQDLAVFGAQLAQQRWAHDKQHPGKIMKSAPSRWLDALESYEAGNPEALFDCAEQCAPSIILQAPEPGPVHPSLKNGSLPAHHSGLCGGQFGKEIPESLEDDVYFRDSIHPDTFSAASTMLLSCTKAAARTIFSDPICIQAIRDAAKVVDATPVAESKRQ